MRKSTLSKTLRAIAIAVNSLKQHELDAIIGGKGKLVFLSMDKFQDTGTVPPRDIATVLDRLSKSKDREEARRVLADITSKDALTSIARSMKIHVVKHDRREDIENKIVEFAIGGKLRSEAIQSLNMKGGSGHADGG